MTAVGQEEVVILAFGIISGLSAYYGLIFLESPEIITKNVGKLFFSMSILFLLLILNTAVLLVNNDATLSYLSASIIDPAMMVAYYILVLGVCAYILFLIIESFRFITVIIKNYQGKKRLPKHEEGT